MKIKLEIIEGIVCIVDAPEDMEIEVTEREGDDWILYDALDAPNRTTQGE
jgi:hypothetical protein